MAQENDPRPTVIIYHQEETCWKKLKLRCITDVAAAKLWRAIEDGRISGTGESAETRRNGPRAKTGCAKYRGCTKKEDKDDFITTNYEEKLSTAHRRKPTTWHGTPPVQQSVGLTAQEEGR